jgi:hypothetical protein
MTDFSPVTAAFEGLRVMRREPRAVFSWVGVWMAALVVIGALEVFTAPRAFGARPPTSTLVALVHRFGPLWPILVATLLVLWIMTTATVFRAVLRPDEHGWHLFKLGRDETLLAAITAAGSLLLVVFGSGPALVLFVLVKPVLAVVPALGRWIVAIGTVATLCLEFWIAVRLSLAPVHTFAEGRFHVVGYWRLTGKHFWSLLLSYLIVVVEICVFLLALGLVVLVFGWIGASIGAPHGLDLLKRASLLGLVLVAAVLSAVFFVAPLILVCACQASAYRAITSPRAT